MEICADGLQHEGTRRLVCLPGEAVAWFFHDVSPPCGCVAVEIERRRAASAGTVQGVQGWLKLAERFEGWRIKDKVGELI
jgi:hypothetical protein